MNINISQHALTRYVERIKQKDDILDVNTYLSTHTDKVREDISKMIEFGKVIYSGKQKPPNEKTL